MSKAEQILMIAIICYKNAQKHFKKQMKVAHAEQEIEAALKEFEPIFNRLLSEAKNEKDNAKNIDISKRL